MIMANESYNNQSAMPHFIEIWSSNYLWVAIKREGE